MPFITNCNYKQWWTAEPQIEQKALMRKGSVSKQWFVTHSGLTEKVNKTTKATTANIPSIIFHLHVHGLFTSLFHAHRIFKRLDIIWERCTLLLIRQTSNRISLQSSRRRIPHHNYILRQIFAITEIGEYMHKIEYKFTYRNHEYITRTLKLPQEDVIDKLPNTKEIRE